MWFLKLEAVVFSGPDVEPSSDPYSHRLRVSMDFWHSAVDEIFDGSQYRSNTHLGRAHYQRDAQLSCVPFQFLAS